jgi:hypothetical protein
MLEEDFHGKYTLLVFMSLLDPKQSPYFQEVIQAIRNVDVAQSANAQFRIVGIGLTGGAESLRDYLVQNPMPGVWGYVKTGPDHRPQAVLEYVGDGNPQIYLIGPQGKILARDLRPKSLGKIVADTLAK